MAKDIHDKYLDPPFTTDFAIMFLPFENILSDSKSYVNRCNVIEMQKENPKYTRTL